MQKYIMMRDVESIISQSSVTCPKQAGESFFFVGEEFEVEQSRLN